MQKRGASAAADKKEMTRSHTPLVRAEANGAGAPAPASAEYKNADSPRIRGAVGVA